MQSEGEQTDDAKSDGGDGDGSDGDDGGNDGGDEGVEGAREPEVQGDLKQENLDRTIMVSKAEEVLMMDPLAVRYD